MYYYTILEEFDSFSCLLYDIKKKMWAKKIDN